MPHHALIDPAAEDELRIAHAWYLDNAPSVADDFLLRIDDAIAAIQLNPFMYPVVHRDIRRAVVKRFPYCIFFTVDGDCLHVLAVFHGRRDPAIWMARR